MASPSPNEVSISAFFARCELPDTTKDDCDTFVKSRYSGATIKPAPFQGYCSYTVFVNETTAVQFRPSVYKLDIDMVTTACRVFGRLAPETEYLGQLKGSGLHAFSMRRLPGVSLTDYRQMSNKSKSARRKLVRDFAQLQALAWHYARRDGELLGEKRTVGASLAARLQWMAASLPERFRSIASSILDDIARIEALPWVFTHGDFLAANVMVSPYSGSMTGLLDWAEAEWLPFGVGMYGLEELLGEDDQTGQFVYYPEAGRLRNMFWKQLMLSVPEIARDPTMMALVKQAQELGVLLWHGIAFDNGDLNRVVEEGRDDREIQRLAMFLSHVSSADVEQLKLRKFGSSVTLPFSLIRRLVGRV